MSPKESERSKMEEISNLHKTIVKSFIKPCPTPKELGLTFDESRIDKYERLLQSIKEKHEDGILFVIIAIMILIWLGGGYLVGKFLGESVIVNYIIYPMFVILWSFLIVRLGYGLYDDFIELYVKWTFNRLNKKGLSSKDVNKWSKYIDLPGMKKFSKEEISQIEQYISLKKNYESFVHKTEKLVKKELEKNNNLLD